MWPRCRGDEVNIAICGGSSSWARRVLHCPVCQSRRRFVVQVGTGYWSPILCCLGCGDSFSDGYRMQRPFRRGWRPESIKQARTAWATALSPREAAAAKRQALEEVSGFWQSEAG